jgi:hypothetical protein
VTNDGDRFVRLLEILDFLLGKFDIDCAYARLDQTPNGKEAMDLTNDLLQFIKGRGADDGSRDGCGKR